MMYIRAVYTYDYQTYQRLHGAICRDAKRQETELVWGPWLRFIVHAQNVDARMPPMAQNIG